MDNKIFMSRYEPGEGESKFEIVFDEDGARLRTTENDIVLHCESEEQSKEIIDMLTHLQTKETELNHIRQFEHELCEFIKSKSAKNENDFEAGMTYAVGYALGTIWRIYEEGKKHDNTESDSGDRDI